MQKKIIFYSDTLIFGGHEIMSIRLIKELAENKIEYDIEFIINNKNKRLTECVNYEFSNIDNVKVSPLYLSSMIFPFSYISFIYNTLKIKNRLNEKIVLICLQGMIENSFLFKFLLRKHDVFSYIPQVSPLCETRGRFSYIRDVFAKNIFYKQFDGIITISNNHKLRINDEWNIVNNKIYVLNNFTYDYYNELDSHLSGNKRKRFLICGRIDENKAQLELASLFSSNCELRNYELDIIGDGDKNIISRIKEIISYNENIKMLGWVDSVDIKYNQYDCLIIHSLFEGVPLVYLEALSYNLPIISRIQSAYTTELPNSNVYYNTDSFLESIRKYSTDFDYRKLYIDKYSKTSFINGLDDFIDFIEV